jgi:SpoVK/Ycf46/Vps4 family AAA+-type ATPase
MGDFESAENEQNAREIVWIYHGIGEEQHEQDFYIALQAHVASEIGQRLSQGEEVHVGREMRLRVGSYILQARLTHIEPLLAARFEHSTQVQACYQARAQDEGLQLSTFISEVIRYPDDRFTATYGTLVGLDAIKTDMLRKLKLLLRPGYLDDWLRHQYGQQYPHKLAQSLRERFPLLLLEGEVGSGKTALARSVGHVLAHNMKIELALFVVNAQVRGSGHVGELTQNIARAFTEAEKCQEREQIPVLLLIDEADALAQTRGGRQTHHEDDAGVNALIQRIDHLRGRPLAVIFATNLVASLDAALLRRASGIYHFDRPTADQRAEVLRRLLKSAGINDAQIAHLVTLTEPRSLPGFGAAVHRYTYSDLTQRMIPHAVEEAIYAQTSVSIKHLVQASQAVLPTPERKQEET